jgi:predicted phosphodiesterase
MSDLVVLSDLHANAPALQAVVDKEGADSDYIVLGDLMGLLAHPAKTVSLVREISDYTLAGNHDKAIFEHGEGHVVSAKLSEFELTHTLSKLDQEQQQWMLDLPYMDIQQVGQSRIAMCHAYPWPERASGYEPGNAGVKKGDVVEVAATVSSDYDYVFHGHTHEQYDLDCAKFGHDVHFVNPGSLGYDSTYSLVNTAEGTVTHKSVAGEYDWDELVDHVQRKLPNGAPPASKWL